MTEDCALLQRRRCAPKKISQRRLRLSLCIDASKISCLMILFINISHSEHDFVGFEPIEIYYFVCRYLILSMKISCMENFTGPTAKKFIETRDFMEPNGRRFHGASRIPSCWTKIANCLCPLPDKVLELCPDMEGDFMVLIDGWSLDGYSLKAWLSIIVCPDCLLLWRLYIPDWA